MSNEDGDVERVTEPEIMVIQHEHVVQYDHVIRTEPTPTPLLRDFDDPETAASIPMPESKKDFEDKPESKKDFDSAPTKPEPSKSDDDQPSFDRDGDPGRYRTDDQVKEVVLYRYEWKEWPEDVPVKTGLQSYYELRYFSEGMNRKGERYADLYAKHRAKRDLWIDEFCASRASEASPAQLDAPAPESNVVRFPRRAGGSIGEESA